MRNDLIENVTRAIGGDPDREPYYVAKARAAAAVVLIKQIAECDDAAKRGSDFAEGMAGWLRDYARENGVSLDD